MNNIKVCIVGIGNCCSSLLQGIQYYKNINDGSSIPGLIHPILGGFKISDIKIVAAFDIDHRKVGNDIGEAIFYPPNNTKIFSDVPIQGVEVMKGPVLDGVSDHMKEYFQINESQKELSKDEILDKLKESGTEIILNYTPVGSQNVTEFWAQCAIDADCAFINSIPVFISSNPEWAKKFEISNLPLLGDDIKSQIGATELHRSLIQMMVDRGGKIDNTWQLNYGGNCDFLTMLDRSRLKSKKISKTESVQSILEERLDAENIHIGPSDYIPHLKDNKLCDIRIDFRIFGDIPCQLDCKLSVEDSPNSAGCVIDCIRIAKIALNRKIGGPIIPGCSYYMKRPPIQMREEDARRQLEEFINGNIKD